MSLVSCNGGYRRSLYCFDFEVIVYEIFRNASLFLRAESMLFVEEIEHGMVKTILHLHMRNMPDVG